jgi:hypothetical protein
MVLGVGREVFSRQPAGQPNGVLFQAEVTDQMNN